MRIIIAALLVCIVSVAQAQTPGVFAPGTPASSSAMNARFATKQDYNAPGLFTTVDATGGYQQNGVTILRHTNNAGHAFGTDPTDLLIGIGAGAALGSADYLTTAVGWHAMNVLQETNAESSAFGWHSQGALVHGVGNTSLGINTIGSCVTGCSYNMAIGGDSMRNSLSGTYEVGIGVSTLIDDNGGHNIAIGYHTYQSNQTATGTFNIAIGQAAFGALSLTSGSQNVVIGAGDGQNMTSGTASVIVGHQAGLAVTSDSTLVLVGTLSGASLNGSGGGDTCLGYVSCYGMTTGLANTTVGTGDVSSGGCVTTGSRNLTLGAYVCVPSATANYQLAIGNGIYGTGLDGDHATVSHVRIGIGTKTPNATLTIGSAGGVANDGHLGFLGTAPAISGCTGCTLSATASDGAGTLTEGTTQTGFVLTFAIAYATAPTCVVSSPTGHSFTTYTATTTTLTVVNGSQTSSKYSYVCVQ
jgi:hypothetical protein